MNILVIDNYDSFTYNIVYLLKRESKVNVEVVKNDEEEIDEKAGKTDLILLSPGPGKPENSGRLLEIINNYHSTIPMLGVCLGMQAMAVSFRGRLKKNKNPFHGKTSEIYHNNKGVFRGLREGFRAMRYHSLEIDEKSLSKDFEITARTKDNIIMGIRHKKFGLEGVQFHPESILTENGGKLLKNWIKMNFEF